MSGSFDKPAGWSAAPGSGTSASRVQLAADRFQALRAPAATDRTGLSSARPDAAETRTRRSTRSAPPAPIVPAGSVTGRSLTLVVTIMCFLASLTAGAVYMMNQTASQWMRDIASEVTVQVEVKQRTDVDRVVADVMGFLSHQRGIAHVHALSLADTSKLLEPWLGNIEALSALPVPRLIAVELDRFNPPASFDALRAALANTFPGVTLDDHRRWQRQVRTITRSFALGGIAILLLVGAATTAIIVSATKSAMASNRDIVEVLHFVGATDRFIAREFERHFLRLGVRAGIVGAILAVLVFLSMPALMELLGGGAVTMAELRRLVGVTSLDLWGYLLLGIVVMVIAGLCMVTSRIGVFRILNSQH
jgi:cell division transport system permease protein